MQLVAADLHLLPPFQQGRLGDVGVAEAVVVAVGILLHGALQRLGNADIVNDQSALLAREHAVHAGDGLHQVVAAHGLIDVHRGQRGHVEARQPHVSDDGYLHRVVVVLELAGQLLLVGFVANDLLPVFGVLVRTAHHHLHFLRPPGAELQYLAIDLDGDGAGQRHDHRLARQFLSAVVLVVVDNIPCQRVMVASSPSSTSSRLCSCLAFLICSSVAPSSPRWSNSSLRSFIVSSSRRRFTTRLS